MAHRNKKMDEFFANMPNPDAIFESWWPFLIAGGAGTIYGFRQWIRGPKCIGGEKLTNKTVIITGGNGGIGKEIALALANRGGRIILACRDVEAGKSVADDVRKDSGNNDVECMKLDLNSFKSIKHFVDEFKKNNTNLHVLINNAGVMMCPQEKTEDGFDVQFQTNYLGHFLLTELLLDTLKKSEPSRIINVTASAQSLGEIDFDDINSENKPYVLGEMYAQSKLAVVLHTFQLAQRLKDTKVTCNVINPGITNTEIYRHLPLKKQKFIRMSFTPFFWLLMKFAEDGAQMAVYCSCTDETAEVSGKFFKDCKEVAIDGKANDPMLQEQLYQASLKWVKKAMGDGAGGDMIEDKVEEEEPSLLQTKTKGKMERVEI